MGTFIELFERLAAEGATEILAIHVTGSLSAMVNSARKRPCSRLQTDNCEAQIVVVGPDSEQALKDYWQKEELPYVGLANPTHTVAKRYGQEVKLLRLGRMPALMVVDRAGQVVYSHYGGSMSDIPPNGEILAVLDELNE